jgi:fructose-1,6-bisphosphatase II
MDGSILPRNLGLELARTTEAAALNAGRWMGLGNARLADKAASEAMLEGLNSIRIKGHIVMGEEGKPGHDLPIKGQQMGGMQEGPEVDIVVDPIDGRTQLARGYPGAISVAAVAPYRTLWNCRPAVYMDKIIVDSTVAPFLVPECLDAPAAWTLALVARAKRVPVENLTVFVLDRVRHTELIDEIRTAGAHVMLRPDGDIVGALMVCLHGNGVDLLMGIGGLIEGLLSACAIKALGGAMLGRLHPLDEQEHAEVKAAGCDWQTILSVEDLVNSEEVFFAATGITDGPLLNGVIYQGRRAETNSLILRSETKTRRRIFAEHLLENIE